MLKKTVFFNNHNWYFLPASNNTTEEKITKKLSCNLWMCSVKSFRKILGISSEAKLLRKLAIFGSFRVQDLWKSSGNFKFCVLILLGEFSMAFPSINVDNNYC